MWYADIKLTDRIYKSTSNKHLTTFFFSSIMKVQSLVNDGSIIQRITMIPERKNASWNKIEGVFTDISAYVLIAAVSIWAAAVM